jgi:hypothetical protein
VDILSLKKQVIEEIQKELNDKRVEMNTSSAQKQSRFGSSNIHREDNDVRVLRGQ